MSRFSELLYFNLFYILEADVTCPLVGRPAPKYLDIP